MTSPAGKVKGRAKVGAAASIDDKILKHRIKIEQASCKANDAIDKVIDKASNALDVISRKLLIRL